MHSVPRNNLSAAVGIGLSVLGFALFSIMDMVAKRLSTDYSVFEVSFLSALFALPTIAALGGVQRTRQALQTQQLRLHVLRAALGAVASYSSLFAYSRMPLADAYAIAFTAPLFVTMLAGTVLRERVSWLHWGVVVAGFLGVLIILHPGSGVLSAGGMAALAGALFYALSMILIRRMGQSESSTSFALYGCLINLPLSGVFMMPGFVTPTAVDFGLSIISGLLGGAAVTAVTVGFQKCSSAVVAPFQYTQLLWGIAGGYILWGDRPTIWLGIGAAFIIISCLVILYGTVTI